MLVAISMSPPVVHYPAVPKRPKLSLQTSELPITYGTSSRGPSTITTSITATTPTTYNTFNNTYDLTHRASPTSTIASPSIIRPLARCDQTSRSQSPRPKQNELAYTVNLPYGIRPILKNTPFPRVRTNSISASPRGSKRRVFFPAPKQVVFKNAIEEEVVNRIYTARHSDLFACDSETEDEAPESATSQDTPAFLPPSQRCSSITISSTTERQLGEDILVTKSSATPLSSSSSSSSTVSGNPLPIATPSSTRKRRRWEWTLGPLHATQPATEISSPSEAQSDFTSVPNTAVQSEQSCDQTLSAQKFCQDSASPKSESCSKETITAQPQPQFQHNDTPPRCQMSDRSRPTTPPLLKLCTSSSSASATLSPPPFQQRAGSLDGSPARKRKAECLDSTTMPKTIASAGLGPTINFSGDRSNGNTLNGVKHNVLAGQKGPKRRDRAATL